MREAFDGYNVAAFFADPAKWDGWVAKWEADFGAKPQVKATRNHPIQWWMADGGSHQIVRATEALHACIVMTGRRITGATLLRHLRNARRRTSAAGVQIAKGHPDSAMKVAAAAREFSRSKPPRRRSRSASPTTRRSRAVWGSPRQHWSRR